MMQNKVAAAFARRGLTLRRGFELLDTSRSGEVAFEDFITGILEMDGHFSPEQLRHLLALVDTNSNEQIDYHEFNRAFSEKTPFYIDAGSFVELCCVFFAHEMERSRRVLVTHFESHAAAPQVKVEAVRKLVTPFAHEIEGELADLYMQMEALTEGGADDGAGADAFASVLISHGVHSLRSPFFRDATGGVRRLSRALANHSFAAKFAQKLKEGTGESPPAPSSPPRRDGSMPRRPPRAR